MAVYYADPSAILAHTSSTSQSYPRSTTIDHHSNGPNLYDLPIDSENEAEVDELDSDSGEDHDMNTQSASVGPKKPVRRSGERRPGTTLLSSTRVENILQADGGTGNLTMSKEATFVLSIATEEFIKRLSQAGHRHAAAARRNTIVYKDMASSTQQYQEFMFLKEMIPMPITVEEALALRAKREQDLHDQNPALNHVPDDLPPPSVVMSTANKGKGKGKAANGKEKASEKASASTKSKKDSKKDTKKESKGKSVVKDGKKEVAVPDSRKTTSRRTSGRITKPTRDWMDVDRGSAPDEDVIMNGTHHTTPPEATTKHASPSPSPDSLPRPQSNSNARRDSEFHKLPCHIDHHFDQNTPWSGPYTGPASGFLQDNATLPVNPGRTIYSQLGRSENGLNR